MPAERELVGARRLVSDLAVFSRLVAPQQALRGYQLAPGQAIFESVLRGEGQQFALVFSRQAGKDELLAQLLALLLVRYQRRGGNAVLAAPSFRPQAAISRDRLLARLTTPLLANRVEVRDGYIAKLGAATARFVSAAPTANARGQTADLLLIANEAQDIQPDVWDAVFDPMAAATNAVTVFAGTVWSRDTLLARQMRHLERLQERDGFRRVWRVPWQEVAREVPPYGDRVRARIAQFGADHPFIQTEYFLRELDGEGGLFPPSRLAQLRGDHPRQHRAEPGKRYALLIDVAGEEESGVGPLAFSNESRRDSTALTVVEVEGCELRVERNEVESCELKVESKKGPDDRLITGNSLSTFNFQRSTRYRIVNRMAWTGVRHTALHTQLVDLARTVWRASAVVIDATGIGAGLASFLAAALGRGGGQSRIPVMPFVFTAASKSALGWDFLGLIDGGRLKEYADDGDMLTRLYWEQLAAVTYEIGAGPGKVLRWSVPAGRGHDDLVMSAALVSVLDGLDWRPRMARGERR